MLRCSVPFFCAHTKLVHILYTRGLMKNIFEFLFTVVRLNRRRVIHKSAVPMRKIRSWLNSCHVVSGTLGNLQSVKHFSNKLSSNHRYEKKKSLRSDLHSKCDAQFFVGILNSSEALYKHRVHLKKLSPSRRNSYPHSHERMASTHSTVITINSQHILG